MQPLDRQIRGLALLDFGAQDVGSPGDERIGHRHVDEIPLAGLVPAQQCHQDPDQRGRPERDVRHRERWEAGLTAIDLPEAQNAGERLRAGVVRRILSQRPFLAERRQCTVHDAWRTRAKLVVADAKPVCHAWPEGFDDDIRVFGQVVKDLKPFGILEIEHDGFLATLRIAEVGRESLDRRPEPSRRFALLHFDLDDLGAVVGHRQADPGSRQEAG